MGFKKTYAVFLVAFLSFGILYGQQSTTELEGRVISASNDVSAVHVSNVTKNRGTITDEKGFYEIAVNIGDSLVFSAVQFKKKELIVTQEVLDSPLFLVAMEETLQELNEVVITPYNLTGELRRDMDRIVVEPVITASTEGLPNAYLIPLTQSERKLDAARTWDAHFYVIAMGAKLDPLFNYFSGRTKMLNQRVAREAQSKWIDEVRGYYPDSLYAQELNIPENKVGDFIFSCEKDSLFEATARSGDKLQLWEVLKKKSYKYLNDNDIGKN